MLKLLAAGRPAIEEGEEAYEHAISSGRLAKTDVDASFELFWMGIGGRTIGSVFADWMKRHNLTTPALTKNWGCSEGTISNLLASVEPVSMRNYTWVIWRVPGALGTPRASLTDAIREGLSHRKFRSSKGPLKKAMK